MILTVLSMRSLAISLILHGDIKIIMSDDEKVKLSQNTNENILIDSNYHEVEIGDTFKDY